MEGIFFKTHTNMISVSCHLQHLNVNKNNSFAQSCV